MAIILPARLGSDQDAAAVNLHPVGDVSGCWLTEETKDSG
jgi:hypothetical protein